MPAESVSFNYDGADTMAATITNAQLGTTYDLYIDPQGVIDSELAVAGTVVLTGDISAGGYALGDVLNPQVFDPSNWMGATLFRYGTVAETEYAATWAFNGTNSISVTFTGTLGVNYQTTVIDNANGNTANVGVGTGVSQTITVPLALAASGDYFEAYLFDSDSGAPNGLLSVRLFVAGITGAGVAGNPTPTPPAPAPVYTRIYGITLSLSDDGVEQAALVTSLDGFS